MLIDISGLRREDIRIESNVERETDLRIYLIGDGSTREVTQIDMKNRVYHKGNLISILVSAEQLDGV